MLSKEQKIKAYEFVLLRLNAEKVTCNIYEGLCWHLKVYLNEVYGVKTNNLSFYFPELNTYKPSTEIREKLGLYWWDRKDFKSRINAIEEILKTLKQ